jgi:hypothetical protein
MQRSLNASQDGQIITSQPSLGFAAQVAIALIVILLLTLTLAALEVFLSGEESLSAPEAAMI